MIIDNATITCKSPGKPYIDSETGYPREQYPDKYQATPCQVRPVSQDLLARAGSGLPVESIIYEVLIDAADWDYFKKSTAVTIEWYDQEYIEAQVISTEYLQAVNQYKLICRYK